MSTGLSCYAGVVTALLNREKTGKGTWVHGSLLETAVALMGYHLVGWMQGGHMPVPQGSGSGHLVPYQAFKCADGYMLAGAPNDAAWVRFCKALEWPYKHHRANSYYPLAGMSLSISLSISMNFLIISSMKK